MSTMDTEPVHQPSEAGMPVNEFDGMTGVEDIEKGHVAETPLPVTDWNGPEDPDNPQNWPLWKRHFHIVPPAIISFSAYVLLESCSVYNLIP